MLESNKHYKIIINHYINISQLWNLWRDNRCSVDHWLTLTSSISPLSILSANLFCRESMYLMASRIMSNWVTLSFAETVGINSFNLKNIWVRKYFDDGEIFECNNHVLISSLVSQKWTRKSVSLDMLKIFQKYFQPKLFEVYKNVECNNDDVKCRTNWFQFGSLKAWIG